MKKSYQHPNYLKKIEIDYSSILPITCKQKNFNDLLVENLYILNEKIYADLFKKHNINKYINPYLQTTLPNYLIFTFSIKRTLYRKRKRPIRLNNRFILKI